MFNSLQFTPIPLPAGRSTEQQLLSFYHHNDYSAHWILSLDNSSRTLFHHTSTGQSTSFVLPTNFVFLGSLSSGELYFTTTSSDFSTSYLYVVSFDLTSGINVNQADQDLSVEQTAHLLDYCFPNNDFNQESTLYNSILLHDNAHLGSLYPSISVPFHSLRDVLSIRSLLLYHPPYIFGNDQLHSALNSFTSYYPSLTLLNVFLYDGDYFIIASDSSVKSAQCGVEYRLFLASTDSPPTLLVGRSIFSNFDILSNPTVNLEKITPCLGLCFDKGTNSSSLASLAHSNLPIVINIDHIYTSAFIFSDSVSSFDFSVKSSHRDLDLVPCLINHLDYAQTLYYSSKIDFSSLYFPHFISS